MTAQLKSIIYWDNCHDDSLPTNIMSDDSPVKNVFILETVWLQTTI
jgi:hypothetical protein